MNPSYGPWATAIHVGPNPQLSMFWKRRLTMLPAMTRSKPTLTLQGILGLVFVGLLTCTVPTLQPIPATAQQESQPASPESASASNDDKTPDAEPKEEKTKTRSLDIVIAEHVNLWDREILTWDQIVERLREIRRQKGKPIHPNFQFTNGAHRLGKWDDYHDRIFDVYRDLFEPAGVTLGSVSPRASRRYDVIRNAEDLVPKPQNVRRGRVRGSNGQLVAEATVVLLPTNDILSVMLRRDLTLRDPLDEVWTRTDDQGQFEIAAPESGYLLAVLSSKGFALVPVPAASDRAEITLSPLAQLRLENTDDRHRDIDITVRLHPPGSDPACPGFAMYELKFEGEPLLLRLPPASRVTISRSFAGEQGTSYGIPVESFPLEAGEKKTLTLKPVDAAILNRVDELKKRLGR